MEKTSRKTAFWSFGITILIIIAVFAAGMVRTHTFNNTSHQAAFTGTEIFSQEKKPADDFSLTASARGDTWTKIFDLSGEGLTEHNYEAHIYDFTFANNTGDEVSDFLFRLTLRENVYLSSAWNGSVEIHQFRDGREAVETIPDLRDYDPKDYTLDFFTADGETFVTMRPGDYLVYYPSASLNAQEIPIKANEGVTPGFIIYVPIGGSIADSAVEVEYTFHRLLTGEPLFWASVAGLFIWFISIIIYAVTSAQIRKYNERHERDNIIINESIETFTSFIDAKDPYTNGHSKRVAIYTRCIAEEMGYEGEELERIYCVALLHDCGKIGVPDNILRKPGKLTDEEFQIIKSHTVRGGEILSHFKSLEDADEGALYHHERYDGKGYPEGRAGEDIPLIARMICVADSFDAMNTDRVYRNRLTKDHILHEIESNKGKQFDPAIADIMLRLLRENRLPIEA